MKQKLKTLVTARWFPTVTKPILSGLAASGIVIGLHALGITSFTSWQVSSEITPLVGFLVAAIVQRDGGAKIPASDVTAAKDVLDGKVTIVPPPAGTPVNPTLADTLGESVKTMLKQDPNLESELVKTAMALLANPKPTA